MDKMVKILGLKLTPDAKVILMFLFFNDCKQIKTKALENVLGKTRWRVRKALDELREKNLISVSINFSEPNTFKVIL